MKPAVNNSSRIDPANLDTLRRVYEEAFRRWIALAREARGKVDGASPEAASLDSAHNAYREVRDQLARRMLASRGAGSRVPDPADVSRLAHRLWEAAGRPSGTAEDDWFHAEEILRHRQAAS